MMELEFEILMKTSTKWTKYVIARREFLELAHGVSESEYDARIDFLHDRGCVMMRVRERSPKTPKPLEIALSPIVPGSLFELVELLESLHPQTP
jgi:hypothetical protein